MTLFRSLRKGFGKAEFYIIPSVKMVLVMIRSFGCRNTIARRLNYRLRLKIH